MPRPESRSRAAPVAFTKRWPDVARRVRSVAATLALVVGLLAVAESLVTLVWQEPLSAFTAHREQRALDRQLARAETAALVDAGTGPHRAPPPKGRMGVLARRLGRHTAPGDALGRISIPSLGLRFVFVQAVSADALKKGPGQYTGTVLPGQRGTVGIAGHRTTYLAPFRHIDRLESGDRIELRMPYGRFGYTVERAWVVAPTDAGALRPVGRDRLVLTTCTPPFSASERLVVAARLRSSAPLAR